MRPSTRGLRLAVCCGLTAVLSLAVVALSAPTPLPAHPGQPANEKAVTPRPTAWSLSLWLLPSDTGGEVIRDLVVGPSGALWIATNKGVRRFANNQFQQFTHANSALSDDDVFDLAETPAGVVATTKEGVVWFDDLAPSIVPSPLLEKNQVRSVFVQENVLWMFGVGPKPTIRTLRMDPAGRPPLDAKAEARSVASESLRILNLLPGPPGLVLCQELSKKGTEDCNWLETRSLSNGRPGPKEKPLAALACQEGVVILTRSDVRLQTSSSAHKWLRSTDAPGEGKLALSGDHRSVWVARKESLEQLDRGTGTVLQILQLPKMEGSQASLTPIAVAEDFVGRVWIAMKEGLVMADPRRDWRVPPPDAATNKSVVAKNPLGTTWEAGFTPDGGVWAGRDGKCDVFDVAGNSVRSMPGLEGKVVGALVGDPSFVATNKRVYRIETTGALVPLEQACMDRPLLKILQESGDLLVYLNGKRLSNGGKTILEGLPEVKDYPLDRWNKGRDLLDHLEEKFDLSWRNDLDRGTRFLETLQAQTKLAKFLEKQTDVKGWTPKQLDDLQKQGDLVKALQEKYEQDPTFLTELKRRGLDDLAWNYPVRGGAKSVLPAKLGNPRPQNAPDRGVVACLARSGGELVLRTGGEINLVAANDGFNPLPYATTVWGVQSAVVADSRTLLAFGPDSRLYRIDTQPDAIPEVLDPFFLRTVTSRRLLRGRRENAEGPFYFLEYDRVRKLTEKGNWLTHVEAVPASLSSWVSCLVADPGGKGLLIGLRNNGEYSLFRSDETETVKSLPLASGFAGNGVRSILYDSEKQLWVATNEGLFVQQQGKAFHPIRGDEELPLKAPAGSLVKDPEGRIWLATGGALGVWMIPGASKSPKQVPDLARTKALPALCASQVTGTPRIWVGGNELLYSIHPDTLAVNNELGKFREALPLSERTSSFNVFHLAAVGDTLLVLGNRGLFELSVAAGRWTATPVSLPGWPKTSPSAAQTCLRILSRDRAVVTRSSTVTKSQVWLRPAAGQAFEKGIDAPTGVRTIGENRAGEILLGGTGGDVFTLVEGQVALRFKTEPEQLVTPLRGIGTLRDSELIVLDGGSRLFLVNKDGNPRRLKVRAPIQQWTQCADLGGSELLLLHRDGVSLLKLGGEGETASLRRLPFDPPNAHWVATFVGATAKPLGGSCLAAASALLAVLPGNTYQFAPPPPAKDARVPIPVCVLTNSGVWEFDRSRNRFVWLGAIPTEKRVGPIKNLILAATREYLWLGTPDAGLWWRSRQPASDQVPWQQLDDVDGLPSLKITAVVPLEDDRLAVFTGSGHCFVRKEPTGTWSIDRPAIRGITGADVRTAVSFDLDSTPVLALGTDDGVTLRWTDPHERNRANWLHLRKGDGLIDNNVYSLAWAATARELWVGSENGIAVLRLALSDGRMTLSKNKIETKTLTRVEGLPANPVTAISVTDDGQDAWMLTQYLLQGDELAFFMALFQPARSPLGISRPASYGPVESKVAQLTRWSVGKPRSVGKHRVVSTEVPYGLLNLLISQGSSGLRLGPVRSQQGERVAPRLLGKNLDDSWWTWSPAGDVRPHLEIKDRYFWLTANLEVDAFDPAQDNLDSWDVSYGMDRPGHSTFRIHLPPDLWDFSFEGKPHFLVAELRQKGSDPPVRYVVSKEVLPLSQLARITRVALPACLLAAASVLLVRKLLRQRRRAARLRRREIPYIQGEAIQDEARFFGRRSLMTMLRDTLPTTSYALIGEFRIGKSSIQHQLVHLLDALEDPTYVFLPVFVDLQHLGVGADKRFFHFLGDHLLRLTRKHQAPAALLDGLEHTRVEAPADYDSISFSQDVDSLLEHWRIQYAPRQPRIVFQIDECTHMNDFEYETLLKFRAVFVSQPALKTVLSGPSIAKSGDRDHLSPWWNFLREIEVLPLTPVECRALIVEPVRDLFTYDEDALQELMARGEGKPFVLQKLCSDVLRFVYDAGRMKRRIALADVRAALAREPGEGHRVASAT